MEKESFEDEEVAELLNRSFIPVKVDREERPDIDGVYMTVCQMLTGSGGWPLTIFMTPEKKPFFAGTYFPKENRFGRSGLVDILQRIEHIWRTRQEDVKKSAEEITSALHNTARAGEAGDLTPDIFDKTYIDLSRRYDSYKGGFGNAPKFPTPHNLLFLLRHWKRTKEAHALEMTEKTLAEMRKGGIYDHIGFGFHRYSTDGKWLVPHFEKMLYDQALLAIAYLEAYQAAGKDEFLKTAEEIFTYVLRDMTSPEGSFYSAEDADSEGLEGKFYVWKAQEIREILKDDADLFIRVFNIRDEGNWTDPVHGSSESTNILHMEDGYPALAEEMNLSEKELLEKISFLSLKLFQEREKRIHPYKDDKTLTDWNSLMISALVKGYNVSGNENYLSSAEKSAAFILQKLSSGKNLLHRYREGESGLPANLDDYAFFIQALIDLYEATFNPLYLQGAIGFNETVINKFWDESSGGFFFTSPENTDVISRQKDLYDGAVPSGNSVSLLNLLRLSRMINDIELERKATRTASLFAPAMKSAPAGYTFAVSAIEFAVGGSNEIIIAGDKNNTAVQEALRTLNRHYIPDKVILLATENEPLIFELAPFLKEYGMKNGLPTIYVCRNFQCSMPVHSAEEMLKLIQ